MQPEMINTSLSRLREFLKMESTAGILLVIAALVAIVLVNSPLGEFYNATFNLPLVIGLGAWEINKPVLLWINDGLMAIFFFLVGLEIRREAISGHLSSPGAITLPAAGAIGGMLIPSLFYVAFNWQDPIAMRGWAIPAATDIAFALGVLSLLGNRVPLALKVFLLSVAIMDDLGAIIIIALFYTTQISLQALVVSLLTIACLFALNRLGVKRVSLYIVVGLVLWVAVLKSGVHATLAGVLLAFFIPADEPDGSSTLKRLEHDLHGAVAFFVLPVFAFANAGVQISDFSLELILSPVPLGIALGLFLGKQLGVFGFTWLAVRAGLAKLPEDLDWSHIYGASMLTGIGFTMSLFIGTLAFESGGPQIVDERVGILLGSFLSAICGYFWLKMKAVPKPMAVSPSVSGKTGH